MKTKTVTISHDAFDRTSVVRQAAAPKAECAWCGQSARWRYGVERDDRPGRPSMDDQTFCGIGCRRAYHS